MIFARKIYKIPELYMIFAGKNARILRNNCPKNIFARISGGARAPLPPSPAPMKWRDDFRVAVHDEYLTYDVF